MPTRKHWLLPEDATKCEKDIFMCTVENIYNHFDDPIDKLIIALVFELDYPQTSVSQIVGRNIPTVSLRVKKIKTILSTTYRAYLKS